MSFVPAARRDRRRFVQARRGFPPLILLSLSLVAPAQATLASSVPVPGTFYLSRNWRGDAVLVSDANGQPLGRCAYDAYGKPVINRDCLSSVAGEGFTGQKHDAATGLSYFHARYYDADLNRFISPDPASQTASPYEYAGDAPLERVDPDGRMFTEVYRALSRIRATLIVRKEEIPQHWEGMLKETRALSIAFENQTDESLHGSIDPWADDGATVFTQIRSDKKTIDEYEIRRSRSFLFFPLLPDDMQKEIATRMFAVNPAQAHGINKAFNSLSRSITSSIPRLQLMMSMENSLPDLIARWGDLWKQRYSKEINPAGGAALRRTLTLARARINADPSYTQTWIARLRLRASESATAFIEFVIAGNADTCHVSICISEDIDKDIYSRLSEWKNKPERLDPSVDAITQHIRQYMTTALSSHRIRNPKVVRRLF